MKLHDTSSLTAEEKLIAAKVTMLLKLPFFGNLAPRLEVVATDKFPFGATDGQNLYYNPTAIDKLTISEIVFFYAHEIMHICFEHFLRRDERNPTIWNIATDYAINALLNKNKIGTQIKGTLYDKKYEDWPAEKIYDDIYKNAKKLNVDELSQMVLDTHLENYKNPDGSPKSQEEIDRIKNDIKKAIVEAAQASQEAGQIPAGLERLIGSITKPQLPWQDILRESIKSKIKNDFTFMKPNRRSYSSGIYFPSMLEENEIDICIAYDMSGSIDNEAAKKFISEVSGIISEFKCWNIKIWSFDTEVYNAKDYSSYEDSDILNYELKGGGGTNFESNWKFMKELDIVPKLFIMFTDMCPYGSWGDPNYCDTLFVSYGNIGVKAPFGETIEIN
jgi:predicted metal-dependent peptidase